MSMNYPCRIQSVPQGSQFHEGKIVSDRTMQNFILEAKKRREQRKSTAQSQKLQEKRQTEEEEYEKDLEAAVLAINKAEDMISQLIKQQNKDRQKRQLEDQNEKDALDLTLLAQDKAEDTIRKLMQQQQVEREKRQREEKKEKEVLDVALLAHDKAEAKTRQLRQQQEEQRKKRQLEQEKEKKALDAALLAQDIAMDKIRQLIQEEAEEEEAEEEEAEEEEAEEEEAKEEEDRQKYERILAIEQVAAAKTKEVLRKRGTNSKSYCGGILEFDCPCCNGFCGPANGCNCRSCMKQDIKSKGLPKGYLLNTRGDICEKGGAKGDFYCGTNVAGDVCSPNNCCSQCELLKEQSRTVYKGLF